MSKSIRAYHFTGPTLRDGRPIPKPGKWLFHKGPVQICQSGLHASVRAFDALSYAPGLTVHVVECRRIETVQSDKLVCRSRKIVKTVDAGPILVKWTNECAQLASWLASAASYAASFAASNAASNAAIDCMNARLEQLISEA